MRKLSRILLAIIITAGFMAMLAPKTAFAGETIQCPDPTVTAYKRDVDGKAHWFCGTVDMGEVRETQDPGTNYPRTYCDDLTVKNPDPLLCPPTNPEQKIENRVKNVITVVFVWVGVIAVVVIVISGIRYITSQGNPEAVKRAKNGILYASIGLVVTLSAFLITNAVLDAIQGNI